MKVYVHLEDRTPEFTLLYQPESFQTTVSDLIQVFLFFLFSFAFLQSKKILITQLNKQAFVNAYNTKFGIVLDASHITVTNERYTTFFLAFIPNIKPIFTKLKVNVKSKIK